MIVREVWKTLSTLRYFTILIGTSINRSPIILRTHNYKREFYTEEIHRAFSNHTFDHIRPNPLRPDLLSTADGVSLFNRRRSLNDARK